MKKLYRRSGARLSSLPPGFCPALKFTDSQLCSGFAGFPLALLSMAGVATRGNISFSPFSRWPLPERRAPYRGLLDQAAEKSFFSLPLADARGSVALAESALAFPNRDHKGVARSALQ